MRPGIIKIKIKPLASPLSYLVFFHQTNVSPNIVLFLDGKFDNFNPNVFLRTNQESYFSHG